MTMPKTLAALPSSQYATLFDVVLGKLRDWVPLLDSVLAAASTMAARPAASMVALLRNGWVDFQRTACRTDGRGAAQREMETAGRTGELMHGLATNSRFERRGAAVRSCGKAWKMCAMAAGVGEEQWLAAVRRRLFESMTFPPAVVRRPRRSALRSQGGRGAARTLHRACRPTWRRQARR
jgi:hypothetical protein